MGLFLVPAKSLCGEATSSLAPRRVSAGARAFFGRSMRLCTEIRPSASSRNRGVPVKSALKVCFFGRSAIVTKIGPLCQVAARLQSGNLPFSPLLALSESICYTKIRRVEQPRVFLIKYPAQLQHPRFFGCGDLESRRRGRRLPSTSPWRPGRRGGELLQRQLADSN